MLSIITAHKNNIKGIAEILGMLKVQTSHNWEWIIVDDGSDRKKERDYFTDLESHKQIHVIFNKSSQGASKSRNIGADYAIGKRMVFLDSDDFITDKFVANRNHLDGDFAVYANMMMTDSKQKESKRFSSIRSDYLNSFLKAKFAWQTSAILWDPKYFKSLGGFDNQMILLEDIELTIRALLDSSQYVVYKDNDIDFYYVSGRINVEKRPIDKVTISAQSLTESILLTQKLSSKQKSMLSSYYYLNVRYAVLSKNSKRMWFLKKSLRYFRSNRVINKMQFNIGMGAIVLFKIRCISTNSFMRINRKMFKK